ncbi:hypothetical protein KORDIASMS9_02954 [Kordia sp. SMS9]|uniref:hypothetical protein n=1 Tax=Kordia sp. SMS9 TaxID=2282170 RepID=UPI000E0D1905|nr:hypothetical protein [Kordia sp. SMS9]AXG70708.1 hypothetical protein KORDIASMS9_02954 [Kordia sp. SMS9]
MKKVVQLFLCSLVILFSTESFSQVSKEQSKLTGKQLAKHKAEYAAKVKALGMAVQPEYFYKLKIDINKVDEFKSVGVDLVELGNKAGEFTYKEYTLLSNYVVQGVVVERTYSQDKQDFFHTTYKIKVESSLKGGISDEYIYVKTESGLIGEDSYVQSSTEPSIYLGEKVLLMLNRVDVAAAEAAREKGFFDKTLNATSNDFTINGKFTLKQETFFDSHKHYIGNKDEVFSNIGQVQSINKRETFHTKKFK